jgi:OOP family OmpA-OmpF porin
VGSAIRVSLSSVVLFEVDKSELKPEAASELTKVAERVKEVPRARVVIEGHTDDMGSDEHNRRLSESRALAVKAFLQRQLEGRDYTLQAHGYGESRPRASNTTEQGRQENRRVELVIIPVTR